MTEDARCPLDLGALRRSLRPPWRVLDVVEVTESTNADLLEAAPGTVLAAEFQQAGRGRLDRSWTSPPRAGLTFSVVVAPPVPTSRWGWLPLLTGLATARAIAVVTGVAAELKWPNDVLAPDGAKLAGILAQVNGPNVVIGLGLNVSTTADELALPAATSLALAGAGAGPIDRTALLTAILDELGSAYLQWAAAAGDPDGSGLLEDYLGWCSTIGRDVTVSTADGAQPARAIGIDDSGRLVVRLLAAGGLGSTGEQRAVAAADIVHLRTTGPLVR